MSVLIKGMEMPKRCEKCPFCIVNRHDRGDDSLCRLINKEVFTFMRSLPQDCPLIPVPPHGDLIDKDATMNAILEERGEDTSCWFAGIVNDMPAIIPSDKAEECD